MRTRKIGFSFFLSKGTVAQESEENRVFGVSHESENMPAKITLNEVLPVLWKSMELDPSEKERSLNRGKFDQYMMNSETIVSKVTLDRVWKVLMTSRFARPSPYFDNVMLLDVQAVRLALDDVGFLTRKNIHNTHTNINTNIDINTESGRMTVQKVLPPKEGA